MKKIISSMFFIGLLSTGSANAGLYLAAEGGYGKSSSALFTDASIVPVVTLGYNMGGDKKKTFGIEGSWRKHAFEDTLTVLTTSIAYKIETTAISAGLRYWFWMMSLKGGLAMYQNTYTVGGATSAAVGDTTTFYIGAGFDFPLSESFDMFFDYTMLPAASNYKITEFSAGLRINF